MEPDDVPPDVVAPVLPLVPVLLLVPLVLPVPLGADGDEDIVLPDDPMPEPLVDDEELGIDDEELLGVDEVLLEGAPIVLDLVDGVTLPEAVPPVAPMPEAVPEAEPEADGPELQAPRAAAQAMERMSLIMVEILQETGRNLPDVNLRPTPDRAAESHGRSPRARWRRCLVGQRPRRAGCGA